MQIYTYIYIFYVFRLCVGFAFFQKEQNRRINFKGSAINYKKNTYKHKLQCMETIIQSFVCVSNAAN